MAVTKRIPINLEEYDQYIEEMRKEEYPMLQGSLYLDHAGTTLYSKSLMDRFHGTMMSHLFGNTHSWSPSSQRSTQAIENTRLDMLRFFKADPDHFDLVFTANATAAIKLVVEAFRGNDRGFWFGYHVHAHTSLVGGREFAREHRCFLSDDEVERWITEEQSFTSTKFPRLFTYPAQSNMNGRRLPRHWCKMIRQRCKDYLTYSLLDAAAYASTFPLDLSNLEEAPDFTVLSLYKIFGFPDLGALIIRKEAAHVFQNRKYFGGGTVDIVACTKEHWHAKKSGALHEQLEDGTLPLHSIIALQSAVKTHEDIFGTLERVSAHTAHLAKQLHDGLVSLRHANNRLVCTVHTDSGFGYGDGTNQGPIVAFNLLDSGGHWVSNAEVEKLASIKDIHLRTGGVCNPGGVATALNLAPWELRENFSAGHRCGSENDILNGKPTGIIRVSLGAMSTRGDVLHFLEFIAEFFVDKTLPPTKPTPASKSADDKCGGRFHVESLAVYPIKSCAAWQVPLHLPWQIHREGLAWDREWCIVHQSTGKALSQKQHPGMALIRPHLDFTVGVLRISAPIAPDVITVPLSNDPTYFASGPFTERHANVCGDHVKARLYTSTAIAEFFTKAVGVLCTLARFPPGSQAAPSTRHSKAHLQQPGRTTRVPRPILLSNESPILTISSSSLNRLNEEIKARGGKAAHPSVFRANIVLGESPLQPPGREQPWVEDRWQAMRIAGDDGPLLEILGGCRRCQMVCIDQGNGEKNQEPFLTLAKTRRFDGKVLFGVHTALAGGSQGSGSAMIRVGDVVETATELHM